MFSSKSYSALLNLSPFAGEDRKRRCKVKRGVGLACSALVLDLFMGCGKCKHVQNAHSSCCLSETR